MPIHPETALLGWSNEATRDLWEYLISYKENIPVMQGMMGAVINDDQPAVIKLVAESLARHGRRDVSDAYESLETVDWEEITGEMQAVVARGKVSLLREGR